VEPHRLDRDEARRIAVRAQLLTGDRPTDLLAVVHHLAFLQIDPTAAVAPNADLVAWTRLGAAYRPEHLTQALEVDRTLFELNALIRPMSDVGLFLAPGRAWANHGGHRAWLEVNAGFRRDVLARLADAGPLASRDIPDTCQVPWASTGWTNDRNVTQMLEILAALGEVAVSARRGRQRVWDLAERVYPPDVVVVPADEAPRIRDERRLRALGIVRDNALDVPVEPSRVGDAGEPAVVDGLPGTWRVDPAAIGQPMAARTALLSPFDRLVHDRGRALELFDFEYVLEMYKPAAQRRWGYFALPVLHGDRLVGKVDGRADRKAGVFRVAAVHEDVPFASDVADAVRAELGDLAEWLGLALELPRSGS